MALIPYAGKPKATGPRKRKEILLAEHDAEQGRRFSRPKHNKLAIHFSDHEILAITEFGWANNCGSFAASLKLMAKQGRNGCL